MNEEPTGWQRRQLRQAILEGFVRKLEKLPAENEAEIKKTDQDADNKEFNLSRPAILEKTASVSETILNVASQDFHFEVEYSAAQNS